MGGKITGGKEFDLYFAYSVAEQVKNELLECGVPKVEIAGSIRRKKEKVHDVDIVAYGDHTDRKDPLYKYCLDKFGVLKSVSKKIEGTDFKYAVPKRSGIIRGINVEIYPAVEKNWIVNLQQWTGSVDFNIKLRMIALRSGLSISQRDGLIPRGKTEFPIQIETEEQLFKILGMKYLEPKDRY